MSMQNHYLHSTDQNLNFLSIIDGKSRQHNLIGWKIGADDAASPVLFPAPDQNATLVYSQGMNTSCFNLQTGERYANIDSALEALK